MSGEILMCQHFSGHKVKQLYAAIQNPQVIYNHLPNAVAHGYKIPRTIQRETAWLVPGKHKFGDRSALFLKYERSFPKRNYPNNTPYAHALSNAKAF